MANLGDISKINLPNGNVVNIKDTTARKQANWNTNNGVKNLLDVTYDTYTNNECSYVKNADGSITLTISSTVAANRQLNLTDKIDNIYDGMIINGSPTGYSTGNVEYLITGLKADGTYQNEQFSYNGAESTINRGTPKIMFAIFVKSGVTARTVTFYPMVREVGDSTYEPYALPNTKITPELIELVDSGAKNLLNFDADTMKSVNTGGTWSGNTWSLGNNVTLTVNSDKSITLNGTANAGKTVYLTKNLGMAENTYTLSTGALTTKLWAGIVEVGGTENNYTGSTTHLDKTCQPNHISLYVERGCTLSNFTVYPMLCTKAAWDVSQKFVPYVMSNAELTIFTKGVYTSTRFSTNTTGVYVYTGVSFTIPANQIFEFIITDQYTGTNTNFGTGILVADANDDININSSIIAENNIVNSQTGKSYWVRQVSGMTPHGRSSNKTYYVWVNRGSNVESPICMYLRRIV